jgi:hypothetical protein
MFGLGTSPSVTRNSDHYTMEKCANIKAKNAILELLHLPRLRHIFGSYGGSEKSISKFRGQQYRILNSLRSQTGKASTHAYNKPVAESHKTGFCYTKHVNSLLIVGGFR